MIISIIGMPGSGKTHFGSLLAQRLDCPFIDLDAYIMEKTEQSIPELFEQGEGYFRVVESGMLRTLLEENNMLPLLVLACGGGTPCFNNNLQLLHQYTTTVWLHTSHEQLQANLGNSKTIRPLLQQASTADLMQLYHDRKPYYSQAKFTFFLAQEIDSIFVTQCINQLNIQINE